MSEQTETTKKPGLRKTRVGVVTSTKMDKTIVIRMPSLLLTFSRSERL